MHDNLQHHWSCADGFWCYAACAKPVPPPFGARGDKTEGGVHSPGGARNARDGDGDAFTAVRLVQADYFGGAIVVARQV